MKRTLTIFFVLTIFTNILIAQEQPKTIVSVGNSFDNDISLSIGGTVKNNYVSTVEFHKWFYPTDSKVSKWCFSYGIVGIKSNSSIGLLKIGGMFVKSEDEYGDYIYKSYFDWGAEYLLMSEGNKPILYGLSYMKYSGLSIKFGLIF